MLQSLKKALSLLMLCAPSNCWWPFSYHTKMAGFEYSREKNWHKLSKVD